MTEGSEGNALHTVDVHNHFIPREVVDTARKGTAFDGLRVELVDGQEWLVHRQGFRYPLHAGFYDLPARLRSMDAAGIDRAVMSISPTLFMYWAEASEAADFCRRANDEMAAFARESGGRIISVAALPMQDPDLASAELTRGVRDLGMRGAQIGPVVEKTWLDDSDVRKVLATAHRLEVPLILHPYYVGPRPGLEDFYLTNIIGNPLESTISAARLIFGGVLDELPGLSFVLMHGGGFLPYQIGRLDHGFNVRPESKGCQKAPSSYLQRFFYDTITHASDPLRFLVDTVGSKNVVFGTDYPYDMAGGPLTQQLDGTGLDDSVVEDIAWRNTTALFKLPNYETAGIGA
jgi:aminocarboxymuconate-semialdehyde decarboxylase